MYVPVCAGASRKGNVSFKNRFTWRWLRNPICMLAGCLSVSRDEAADNAESIHVRARPTQTGVNTNSLTRTAVSVYI